MAAGCVSVCLRRVSVARTRTPNLGARPADHPTPRPGIKSATSGSFSLSLGCRCRAPNRNEVAMPLVDKIERYTVSVFHNDIVGYDRSIRLPLESGGTAQILSPPLGHERVRHRRRDAIARRRWRGGVLVGRFGWRAGRRALAPVQRVSSSGAVSVSASVAMQAIGNLCAGATLASGPVIGAHGMVRHLRCRPVSPACRQAFSGWCSRRRWVG
jgi:hypothetical protein